MDASSGNESENQQSASAPASFSSPSASSSLGEIVGDTVQIEQEARGSNPQIATTDRWEAEYETAGTRNVSSEQPSAAASAVCHVRQCSGGGAGSNRLHAQLP